MERKITVNTGCVVDSLASFNSKQGGLNAAEVRKAVQQAFRWSNTPQGQNYWQEVANALQEIANAPIPATCDKLGFLSDTQKAKLRELLK